VKIGFPALQVFPRRRGSGGLRSDSQVKRPPPDSAHVGWIDATDENSYSAAVIDARAAGLDCRSCPLCKGKYVGCARRHPTYRLFKLLDHSYDGKLAGFWVVADTYTDPNQPGEALQHVLILVAPNVNSAASRFFGISLRPGSGERNGRGGVSDSGRPERLPAADDLAGIFDSLALPGPEPGAGPAHTVQFAAALSPNDGGVVAAALRKTPGPSRPSVRKRARSTAT
jgi:hypothetical protein